jgi:hypothetical protein
MPVVLGTGRGGIPSTCGRGRTDELPGTYYLQGDTAMSYRIGLYEGSTRQGEIELDTLFVMDRADYVCEPRDVLTDDEVRQVAKTLRRAPDIHAGMVGRYDWREERPPIRDERAAMTRKAIREMVSRRPLKANGGPH